MSTVILPNIALIGKAGAGKSTTADLLVSDYGYTKASIAQPLKEIAASLWGAEAASDRGALQQLGVAVRQIEPDTWIDLLTQHMADDGVAERWVVDDVRFPNELDLLGQSSFAVVRVWADKQLRIERLKTNGKWHDEDQLTHESETALDAPSRSLVDWTIDNSQSGQYGLPQQVAQMLDRIQR